jgi:hypothetical protein
MQPDWNALHQPICLSAPGQWPASRMPLPGDNNKTACGAASHRQLAVASRAAHEHRLGPVGWRDAIECSIIQRMTWRAGGGMLYMDDKFIKYNHLRRDFKTLHSPGSARGPQVTADDHPVIITGS